MVFVHSRFRILKGGKISLIVSSLLYSSTLTFAAPTGGKVTSGAATISQNGNITNIHQTTNKATINWQSFSISQNEIVNFNQPNSSAITLNRVVGNEKSIINGALNANGQVWILNSNGVLFGKNARVNTSGILATTAKLSDEDFNVGNYNFKNTSTNSVINQGTIEISNKGSVILASKEVLNEGTIKAVKGNIHLVGADEYSINLNGNSLVDLRVDKGVLDAMVSNSGTILANGGEVYLTTNAIDELLKGVVNNSGIIEANGIDDVTGHIELFAHGGIAQVGGSITAEGGFIETSGKDFTILADSNIKAKEWLIDPVDLIVNDATAYETALNNGTNTTIQTDNSTGTDEGNIYIVDTINWSSAAKLTLDAYNDIYINADINAPQGSLALYYGQGSVNSGNTSSYYFNNATINLSAGNKFFTKLGNDVSETSWTVITSLGSEGSTTGTDLQGINGNLSGNYVLGADIDGSSTSLWNSGNGWDGIGAGDGSPFTGNFDGLGHTISGISMNRVDPQYYFGLFDNIQNATMKNLTLENFYMSAVNSNAAAASATAALAGYASSVTIENVKVLNSTLTGGRAVAGLIGQATNSDILNSSVVGGSITGYPFNTGGLVGTIGGNSSIKNSYTDTSVYGGSENTGGLVGRLYNTSTIENSYAKGLVSGTNYVGGLVGNISHSTASITNSYASNTVTGSSFVGGLVGDNSIGASITESYYDNEKNTDGTMDDASFGRTKAQLLTLVSNNTWDNSIWGSQSSDFDGYAIGTITLPQLQNSYNGTTLFLYGTGTATNPYRISNWTQLQNINYNTDTLNSGYYYTLTNDLTTSLSDYISIASLTANGNLGWNPIGNEASKFTGYFDGLGFSIDGLSINRNQDNIGLFGYTTLSTISNLGLTNVDIRGATYIGALVGYNDNSIINNSYSSGAINSSGQNFGGLVGINMGSNSEINYSYSSANVTGLVSSNRTGGLVGWNYSGASIKNSYATGNVSAGDGVGGLVGSNESGSVVENSYSTGHVSGTGSWLGGLVGWSNATVTNSFWDTQGSGQATSAGGTELTTAQMSYGKYFFDAGWDIVVDSSVTSSTPILKFDTINNKYVWAVAPLGLTYNLGSKTTAYDGTPKSLSDFYTTSSSIFGSEYDFLNLTSSDYVFQVNGDNVTEYTDEGTYSNIKLVLTNSDNFLSLSNTGNVDGTLSIYNPNATVPNDAQPEDAQPEDTQLKNTITSIIKTIKPSAPTEPKKEFKEPNVQEEVNKNITSIDEVLGELKPKDKPTENSTKNVETTKSIENTIEQESFSSEKKQNSSSDEFQNQNTTNNNPGISLSSNTAETQTKQNEDSTDSNSNETLAKDEKKVVAEQNNESTKPTEDNIQLNDAQIEMTVDGNGNIVYSQSKIEVKVNNNGQLKFGDNSSDVLETMGLSIKDISIRKNKIRIDIVDKKANTNYSASLAEGDSLLNDLVINTKTGKITGTLPKNTSEISVLVKATGEDKTVRIVSLKIKLNIN